MTLILLSVLWLLMTIRGGGLFARFQKEELLFRQSYSYGGHFRDKQRPRDAHWGDLALWAAATLFIGSLICFFYDSGTTIHKTFTSKALKTRPDQIIALASGTAVPRAVRKEEKMKAKNEQIKSLEARNAELERELGL